ncbi:MAG: hypothetical protein ACFFE8_15050 [Candidatus Heimdallarchaeota archaeon]
MADNRISTRLDSYARLFLTKLRQTISELLSFIVEFKSAFIVLLIWMILGGFAVVPEEELTQTGFFPVDVFFASLTFLVSLIGSILELILYPIDLIINKKPFDQTKIPEIFILLMPLVIMIVTSFLIMVWTED